MECKPICSWRMEEALFLRATQPGVQPESEYMYRGRSLGWAQGLSAGMQNKPRIDIGRLRRLSSAFGDYTVEGLTASPAKLPVAAGAGAGQPGAALDKTTAEALKLVFSREGSYAQVLAYKYPCVTATPRSHSDYQSLISAHCVGEFPRIFTSCQY